MKIALGIVVLLLGTSVASAQYYRNPYVQSDWDPYWDHTRHLRNISWSLQDMNWTIQEQNFPQQPDGPAERLRTLWETNPQLYTRMSLGQQAASSAHHSVMRRQQYKKDRRARTRAKMRDEALDREMRERGIVVVD